MKSKIVLLNIIWGSVTLAALVFGFAGYKQATKRPLTTAQVVSIAHNYSQLKTNQEKKAYLKDLIIKNQPLISFSVSKADSCKDFLRNFDIYNARIERILEKYDIPDDITSFDGSNWFIDDQRLLNWMQQNMSSDDQWLVGAYHLAMIQMFNNATEVCGADSEWWNTPLF